MNRRGDPEAPQALRQVPDRSTAEVWWQTQAPVWGDERRIQAVPLDVGQLIPMAKDRVGETAMDLLDLLAHQLRRPLGIARWGWSAYSGPT